MIVPPEILDRLLEIAKIPLGHRIKRNITYQYKNGVWEKVSDITTEIPRPEKEITQEDDCSKKTT